MRELNRKEGAMVSGGKKLVPIIVNGYPLPSFNTKLIGQVAANFINSLGTGGYIGTGIGEQGGGGGGGGGGSPYIGKTTTGTHKVDSKCFTSKKVVITLVTSSRENSLRVMEPLGWNLMEPSYFQLNSRAGMH